VFSAKLYFVLSCIISSQYLIFNHLCTIFPTLDAFYMVKYMMKRFGWHGKDIVITVYRQLSACVF